MCRQMKPCPALEYAAVILLVIALAGALYGLGKATSAPLTTVTQTLERSHQ